MHLRLSAITIFLLFTISSSGKVRIGAFIGATSPYWIFERNYHDSKMQLKPFLHAGLQSDIKLNKHTGIQIGLCYNRMGSKYEYSEVAAMFNGVPTMRETKRNFNLNYISLPVDLRIGIAIKETEVYGTLGFYGAYLISGKSKMEVEVDGVKDHEDDFGLDIGTGSYQMHPGDYGPRLGAGVNFNSGLFIKAWYSIGLKNLYYSRDDIRQARNAAFGFSAGLFFNQ
jgi:hypothetical protein